MMTGIGDYWRTLQYMRQTPSIPKQPYVVGPGGGLYCPECSQGPYNTPELVQQHRNALHPEARTSAVDDKGLNYTFEHGTGTFGFINGKLYLGHRHHKAIMAWLLNHGWDWESLMNAEQAWGWWYQANNEIVLKFVSDSGYQNDEAAQGALRKFTEVSGYPAKKYPGIPNAGVQNEHDYGTGLGSSEKPDAQYGERESIRVFSSEDSYKIWIYRPETDELFTAPGYTNHYDLVQRNMGGWMTNGWTGGYYNSKNDDVEVAYNEALYEQNSDRIGELLAARHYMPGHESSRYIKRRWT